MSEPPGTGAPQLSAGQFARLAACGVAREVRAGEVVFQPGDPSYDLIVIEAGWIEIVSPATGGEPEAVIAAYGPGGFLGELGWLTGQTAQLTARATRAGRIHRISPERFRRLMAEDPDLSAVILRAFVARHGPHRSGPPPGSPGA